MKNLEINGVYMNDQDRGIISIFPTNILIEDLDLNENDAAELDLAVEVVLAQFKGQESLTQKGVGENHLPLFTEENINNFPVLSVVREHFINGFTKLAESYDDIIFDRDTISKLVHQYTGRLPFMEKGEYKDTHNHTGAIAFGIMYLSDVDNKNYGGLLKLFDPAWSNTIGIKNNPIYEVETKRHRLIIGPANMWHSVSTYTGDETRATIVINLDPTPLHMYS